MVCDEVCLNAVRDQLPAEEPLALSTSVVCATCFACSLTVEGTHCPCTGLEVSCSAPSWLLCTQARTALDTIYEAHGPTVLTDADWQQLSARLGADWIAAAEDGTAPESERAQELARRHVAWLAGIPGTPGAVKEYVTSLGDMYVADPRFAANYGGEQGATLVRDALRVYAEANL